MMAPEPFAVWSLAANAAGAFVLGDPLSLSSVRSIGFWQMM